MMKTLILFLMVSPLFAQFDPLVDQVDLREESGKRSWYFTLGGGIRDIPRNPHNDLAAGKVSLPDQNIYYKPMGVGGELGREYLRYSSFSTATFIGFSYYKDRQDAQSISYIDELDDVDISNYDGSFQQYQAAITQRIYLSFFAAGLWWRPFIGGGYGMAYDRLLYDVNYDFAAKEDYKVSLKRDDLYQFTRAELGLELQNAKGMISRFMIYGQSLRSQETTVTGEEVRPGVRPVDLNQKSQVASRKSFAGAEVSIGLRF